MRKAGAMRAWEVRHPGPMASGPMELVGRPAPEPGPGEIRVRVTACGVCRTDLHVAEGDLPVVTPNVIPGHEIVGVVDAVGDDATRFALGARVGIPWLRQTCRTCRFCTSGRENLCIQPEFTGWTADGGYADFAVVDQDYAYEIPDTFDDEHAAPLLCAGIIGYRALRRADLPPGGRLGIYGFGGSAHIACQVAVSEGAEVYVFTRSARARTLADRLGARWTGDGSGPPPSPLDSSILFAPAGVLVPVALEHLDRGGTLAVAGIHLSTIPTLDYRRHLFEERRLVSVTANTRRDGRELLAIAARIPVHTTTTLYPLEEADIALGALAQGEVPGAAVLKVSER
jgi:alcohol dehydrogenase, propanol-preferring